MNDVNNSVKILNADLLEEKVIRLINFIFDSEKLKLVFMKYNLEFDKFPLQLHTIETGFNILEKIESLMEKKEYHNEELIEKLSYFFYKRIPFLTSAHTFSDIKSIREKQKVISDLIYLDVFSFLIKKVNEANTNIISETDFFYEQINTEIKLIKIKSKEYEMIKNYIHMTSNLEVEIFQVRRKAEDSRYKELQKFENRFLLWYGSESTNFPGILTHGLKITPTASNINVDTPFGNGNLNVLFSVRVIITSLLISRTLFC